MITTAGCLRQFSHTVSVTMCFSSRCSRSLLAQMVDSYAASVTHILQYKTIHRHNTTQHTHTRIANKDTWILTDSSLYLRCVCCKQMQKLDGCFFLVSKIIFKNLFKFIDIVILLLFSISGFLTFVFFPLYLFLALFYTLSPLVKWVQKPFRGRLRFFFFYKFIHCFLFF